MDTVIYPAVFLIRLYAPRVTKYIIPVLFLQRGKAMG